MNIYYGFLKNVNLSSASLKRFSKTKLIRVGDTVSVNFKITNQDIDEVKEFCYLGNIINNRGGMDPDVERRSTKISQNLKLKLY